jgi:zinc and cadmium transporter
MSELSTLIYIIAFTSLGSLLALTGGVLLLGRKNLSHDLTHGLAAFAAGALLGAAFLDLIPESFHHMEERGITESEGLIMLYVLSGILLFFLLERFIHWFHHHRQHVGDDAKPIVSLVVFGDGVHNFVDGVVIAATFLADINLGIITTFAIAAHELPQEVGDFGILLHKGVKRGKVFLYNLVSQLASVIGGILTFFIGSNIEGILPMLLAGTSGFFIYIALSDLVPDIHNENRKGFAVVESGLLVLGILVIWGSMKLLGHG